MATRYPRKNGVEVKGVEWTELALKGVKAEWAGETLSDGGGLYGAVSRSRSGAVTVRWTYKYRCPVRKKGDEIGCGTWPETSLKDVRQARNRARDLVGQGVSPKQARDAVRIEAQQAVERRLAEATAVAEEELTVRCLFNAWFARLRRNERGMQDLRRNMERDLLAAHGHRPLRSLRDTHLYEALDTILARRRGSQRPGHRQVAVMRTTWRQMLGWGEKRQPWRKLLAEGDPAQVIELEEVLPNGARANVERERTLSEDELRELWEKFPTDRRRYEEEPDRRQARHPMNPKMETAIWLCVSTLTRRGALMLAEWKDVDFEARQWFIPAKNQKQTRAQKKKPRDLVIELSDFALGWFRRQHALTGHTVWCYPNPKGDGPMVVGSISHQIGDRQAMFSESGAARQKSRSMNNDLVLAGGSTGRWGLHDLRRTGATMMEGLGVSRPVIARCLGHVTEEGATALQRKTEREGAALKHYLHHPYRDEMRDSFDRLGKSLEAVVAPRLVHKAA